MKIRRLRTLAEQKPGTKFDVREFHDVVLRNGRLPPEPLGEQVNEHIQQTLSPKPL